jgi:hypothetical protein
MSIITVPELAENEFITDLDIEITHYLTHLGAPTGRGKSTYIIEELSKLHKILFLCAVNLQVEQIGKDYQDDPRVQCITNANPCNRLSGQVVVAVYDKLAMLLERFDNIDDYVLVVDEAHKIYQAAPYRQSAVAAIVDAITNNTFKQVVTVSATFIPEIFPATFNEQILISHQPAEKPAVDVVFHNKKELMKESLLQICPTEGKVAIVRINNKEEIKLAKTSFKLQSLRVLEVHSENQRSPEVVDLLQSSKITNYDIVLTTSLLDEAINIKNENIESVHVFHRLHTDELKQFIGRCRKSIPNVELHLLNSELERRDIDLSVERANIEAESEISLKYAQMLGKKTGGYTQIVKRINTTTKEFCGFEPLKYDYRTDQAPSINEVTKLAKLYEVATQSQYTNDDSLRQALLLSDCFSEVNIHDGAAKSDPEIAALLAQATEILAEEKATAIQECLVELDCSDGDVSELTINNIADLAKSHEQSGTMGEIASRWKSLCLILPTQQALDVIEKGREKDVWEFNKAVTKRIDYQPFFNKIKAATSGGNQLSLIGKDNINTFFSHALSEYAKEDPNFKDYIRKLRSSKLQVLKNNKFKLSNRFLYTFIRDFTDHEEKRTGGIQCFIIKGIGLFGYDYKIRQLMISSPKRPKRLFPRPKKPTGQTIALIDDDELPM